MSENEYVGTYVEIRGAHLNIRHNVTLVIPKGATPDLTQRTDAPFVILDPWAKLLPWWYNYDDVGYVIEALTIPYDGPWRGWDEPGWTEPPRPRL
jgi:hypothetical protein